VTPVAKDASEAWRRFDVLRIAPRPRNMQRFSRLLRCTPGVAHGSSRATNFCNRRGGTCFDTGRQRGRLPCVRLSQRSVAPAWRQVLPQ
jgi:hypothetical protein